MNTVYSNFLAITGEIKGADLLPLFRRFRADLWRLNEEVSKFVLTCELDGYEVEALIQDIKNYMPSSRSEQRYAEEVCESLAAYSHAYYQPWKCSWYESMEEENRY